MMCGSHLLSPYVLSPLALNKVHASLVSSRALMHLSAAYDMRIVSWRDVLAKTESASAQWVSDSSMPFSESKDCPRSYFAMFWNTTLSLQMVRNCRLTLERLRADEQGRKDAICCVSSLGSNSKFVIAAVRCG